MATCLVLHGFTGTPAEVTPLVEALQLRGHQAVVPLLAGHGRTRREMRVSTRREWIESAERELVKLLSTGVDVHVIGFSMGGLIAADLADRYPIVSLAMLSTPIFYINQRQMIHNIAQRTRHRWQQRKFQSEGLDWRRYVNKFQITPLRSVWEFRNIVADIHPILPRVHVPLLVVQGSCDELVQPRSATYIYQQVSSKQKRLVWFEESGHMICLDRESDELCRVVTDFIESQERSNRHETTDTF